MAKEFKASIDLDTARALSQAKALANAVEDVGDKGKKSGGEASSALKSMGEAALSTITAITGIGFSLGGVIAVAQQLLELQRAITAAQALAIANQQAADMSRAQRLTGPEAMRTKAELGLNLGQQARAAADFAEKTGQPAAAWRPLALEAGREQLGEVMGFGRFATATGVEAAVVPDMLQFGMGANSPEARRQAMGQFTALVQGGRIENASSAGAMLQNWGERIKNKSGLNPTAIIAALTKRYDGRAVLAAVSALGNEGVAEHVTPEVMRDYEQNVKIMAGATPDTMEKGAAAYMAEPEARRVAAGVMPDVPPDSPDTRAADRMGMEMDLVLKAGGKGAEEDIYNLIHDRNMDPKLARRFEALLRMAPRYRAALIRAGDPAGQEGIHVGFYFGRQNALAGWSTTEKDVNKFQSVFEEAQMWLEKKGRIDDIGIIPRDTAPTSRPAVQVNIGQQYNQTPSSQADSPAKRGQ